MFINSPLAHPLRRRIQFINFWSSKLSLSGTLVLSLQAVVRSLSRSSLWSSELKRMYWLVASGVHWLSMSIWLKRLNYWKRVVPFLVVRVEVVWAFCIKSCTFTVNWKIFLLVKLLFCAQIMRIFHPIG